MKCNDVQSMYLYFSVFSVVDREREREREREKRMGVQSGLGDVGVWEEVVC